MNRRSLALCESALLLAFGTGGYSLTEQGIDLARTGEGSI